MVSVVGVVVMGFLSVLILLGGFSPVCSAGADAFQQHGGGFVVRVLRYQLATEGLGEQRGRQALDLGAGGGVAGFEAVGVGEQGFDAADDFRCSSLGGSLTAMALRFVCERFLIESCIAAC